MRERMSTKCGPKVNFKVMTVMFPFYPPCSQFPARQELLPDPVWRSRYMWCRRKVATENTLLLSPAL